MLMAASTHELLLLRDGNKQARVLAFDGVRAEESTRRSGYNRVGKGKHINVFNAHPILDWSVTEAFLYIMLHQLPNNPAYRLGFSRVGCVICPFGSEYRFYVFDVFVFLLLEECLEAWDVAH